MGRTTTLPQNNDSGSVPEWSGRFTRLTAGLGMMMVHLDDKSSPQFPDGWASAGEPFYHGEAVVWLLVGEE